MENGGLLNTTKPEDIEADQSVWKIIVLAAIGLGCAFLAGYFLKDFLIQGGLNSLLFCFAAGAGFLIIFILEVLFLKTFWLTNLIVFVQTLGFLSLFYDKISQNFLLGALVGFLIFLWGIYSGRTEIQDMVKIRFWRVSERALPKAITGLALLISVISVGFFSFTSDNFFISQATFEKIVLPFNKLSIIQSFAPGFDLSLPISEMIKNMAISQIQNDSQLKNLPAAAQNQVIDQTVKDLQTKISDSIGVPFNPQATASQTLYQMMIGKISELPENIKSFIPLAVAILIFLSIVSLSWPIRMLISVPAYLIYEICLALGFSSIITEGRSGEIIILK